MEGSGDEIEREVGEGLLMAGGRQIDMIIYTWTAAKDERNDVHTERRERGGKRAGKTIERRKERTKERKKRRENRKKGLNKERSTVGGV